MNKIKWTLLLCSAPLAWTGTAFAQSTEAPADAASQSGSAAEDAAVDTGDIVVTAQKRSERLSRVPISVSAATGEQLLRRNITSAADLGKIASGFVYTRSAYGQPIFSIRGIGFYEEAIGISPTVTAYVDQAPIPFPRMTEGAVLDLERVEVLKGPQGTLFGMNSTGGAINFVAAKPTSYLTAGGELTFGRFAQAEAQAYVSGPLTSTLNARLVVRSEQRGDWQRSHTRDAELGQRDYGAARLLLDWQPSPSLRFGLNINGWYNKSDTLAKQNRGWAPINPSPTRYQNAPGYPNYEADLKAYPLAPFNARAADWNPNKRWARDDTFYMIALNAEADLTERVTLTSITAFSHMDIDFPTDNDGTAIPDHEQSTIGELQSFSQEARLAGSLGSDDRFKWVIGGNYQKDKANDLNVLNLNGSNSGIGAFRYSLFHLMNNQRVETLAAFASADFKLLDTLSVQGSIRYTDQKRDFRGCVVDPGDGNIAAAFSFLSGLRSGSPTVIAPGACVTLDATPGSPTFGKPLPIVTGELDEDNISWRAGLSWTPTSDTMIYANVSRGYKAGAFGTLALVVNEQSRPVGQESVLAYELGFKSSFVQGLQVTGALFRYNYDDKQLRGLVDLGPPFGAIPALASIPKSRVNGAEMEFTWRPADPLTFKAGGTYVDSKVLLPKGAPASINDVPDPLGAKFNTTGSPFPNTPKWQLTFDGEYRFPVSGTWAAFVGGGGTYRSDTRSFFGGDLNYELPGYALFDVRAGFEREVGQLRVLFWGKNVTNKYYRINSSRVHDTVTWSTGMPVTYGITFSARM